MGEWITCPAPAAATGCSEKGLSLGQGVGQSVVSATRETKSEVGQGVGHSVTVKDGTGVGHIVVGFILGTGVGSGVFTAVVTGVMS